MITPHAIGRRVAVAGQEKVDVLFLAHEDLVKWLHPFVPFAVGF